MIGFSCNPNRFSYSLTEIIKAAGKEYLSSRFFMQYSANF
jgi:hypothetical protein